MSAPYQDYVVLAGVRCPVLSEVKGMKLVRKWNVPDGWGFSGARAWFIGQQLIQFSIIFSIWADIQWALWIEFAEAVFREPTKGLPSALSMSIVHPIVNMPPHKVTQVVMMEMSGWDQDDTGLWTCSGTFLQYREPKPALIKPPEGPPPAGEQAGPPTNPKLDIVNKNNAEIARLAGS